MINKIVIMCMLAFAFGCADKNNAVSTSTPMQQAVPSKSVFTELEMDFVEFEHKGVVVANPKQTLEKINAQMQKAEQEAQDLTALLVLRALVQSQLGSNDAAFDDMTEAVQLRPNAELYALRALVLWRGGKMRGAMLDAEYALQKQNNLPLGQMVEGLVWLEENELSEACAALKSACEAGQCYGLEHANKQGQCN